MPTKIQTKLTSRRLTKITVNGNTYDIDKDCCIVVGDEDQADLDKLLSLNGEWSTNISTTGSRGPARMPVAGQPMRSAPEFVEVLASDTALAEKVNGLRSFRALASMAFNMGFRFSELEFKNATDAYKKSAVHSQSVDAKNDEKMKTSKSSSTKKAASNGKTSKSATQKKPEKAKEAAKPVKGAAVDGAEAPALATTEMNDDKLPKTLPEEESGEWPDPEESMGPNYLRRMAAAYKVKYNPNISKSDLVEKIQTAMYAD